VKPWLVQNCDPGATVPPTNPNCNPGQSYFVRSDTDGSIANNGSFISETIDFQVMPNTGPPVPKTIPNPPPGKTQFYALDVPINPPTPACPSTGQVSCGLVGTNNYLDNIACSSTSQFWCGQPIGTGQTVTVLTGSSITLANQTREGTRCVTHTNPNSNNPNDGQDAYPAIGTPPPIAIAGGTNNPNPSLQGVANISRSDSVVTVPLVDGCIGVGVGCSATRTIVGFLQIGIVQTRPGPGGPAVPKTAYRAVILNATGCNPATNGNPVSGTGTSTLPVRLISP
jgi:hypothetical protein